MRIFLYSFSLINIVLDSLFYLLPNILPPFFPFLLQNSLNFNLAFLNIFQLLPQPEILGINHDRIFAFRWFIFSMHLHISYHLLLFITFQSSNKFSNSFHFIL